MSVGPMSAAAGMAGGIPLAQSKGSEIDRSQQDSTTHSRKVESVEKAEMAAGIGQTSEDQQADERDADGRRLWEDQGKKKSDKESSPDAPPTEAEILARKSIDPTGESGNRIDMTI